MTETRGSWTLDEAVVAHWRDHGLDAAFRDLWVDTTDTSYFPLHHEQAEPEPPGPYATYTIGEPVRVAGMSGLENGEVRELLDYTLTIRVHAKTSGSESGKSRAKALAKLVIAAFGQDQQIEVCDDHWVQTRPDGDQCLRLGTDEWAWICRFTIQIEAAYATR